MGNYAVIRELDGMVINTIVASSEYQPPAGHIAVLMTENNYGGPGWTWTGSTFIDPSPAILDSPVGDASGGD